MQIKTQDFGPQRRRARDGTTQRRVLPLMGHRVILEEASWLVGGAMADVEEISEDLLKHCMALEDLP